MRRYHFFQLLILVLVLRNSKVYCATSKDNADTLEDPDINRNVSELIFSKGYPVENHIVQTTDGYLLSVQRIPYGRLSNNTGKRKPLLLQHGLLSSSADWVLNYPHQSLGFLLADFGYDVWLGNTRGNTYSKKHVNLDPGSSTFWNFSFDQMAEYDVPAMIDYILNATNETDLIYIGHSQGTTVGFALLSENPFYNRKIKFFVALAPEVEVSHAKTTFRSISPYIGYIQKVLNMFGVNEFLPNTAAIKFLTHTICGTKSTKFICEKIMFTMYGTDKEQLNQTRLPVYASHFPNGASTKNVVHFYQMLESKKFRKYDYGAENMMHYKQNTPPEYDISKISTPIAIFFGMNDVLSDREDIRSLEKKLKTLVYSYCVPWKDFNHSDFLIAKDARQLVYDEILSLLKKSNNGTAVFANRSVLRRLCS